MSKEAHALVAAFREEDTPGAWRLDRAAVAGRLDDLVAHPGLVRQGRLNLCGPAALLAVWFARDPVAAVRYAVTLFDVGQSHIGDLQVTASRGLITGAYGQSERSRSCPQADWMMMSAMRDSANVLLPYSRPGRLREPAAAITMPGAMRRWLGATGCYSTVVDETNLVLRKGIAHAVRLKPAPDQDVLLLVAQEMFRRPSSLGGRVRDRLVSLVPNHWLVLVSPVRLECGEVRFAFWSWGAFHTAGVDRSTFARCYYGALRLCGKALAASQIGA
jgi:hypothetical protein